MSKLSQLSESYILNQYVGGDSPQKVCEDNKISYKILTRILTQNNVQKRAKVVVNEHNRRVKWNINFFEHPSPKLAYWAGFIFADGCLKKCKNNKWTNYKLNISLNEKDREHLEVFCNDIGLSKDKITNIPARRGAAQVQVNIGHKRLLDFMTMWGVVPRKTYNFVKPDIPNHLLPHFIRGWIDGDGNIAIRGYGKSNTIRITGNKDALIWLKTQLEILGFSGKIYFSEWKENQIWGKLVIINNKNLKEIKELLLCDDHYCLKRKWHQINW